MFQTLQQVDESKVFDMWLNGVDAYDPETGAKLHQSRGRSHGAPKWFLFFAEAQDDAGNWKPYRKWRHTFRAWSLAEAIQHANEALPELLARK